MFGIGLEQRYRVLNYLSLVSTEERGPFVRNSGYCFIQDLIGVLSHSNWESYSATTSVIAELGFCCMGERFVGALARTGTSLSVASR